jgi:hypothetical protein
MATWKTLTLTAFLIVAFAVRTAAMVERRAPASPPPLSATQSLIVNEPWVLTSGGDTAWIQVHVDSTHCPGDQLYGHGGEATGGPGPTETWCFEGGDSSGTNPPWDTRTFTHEDVRAKPSSMDINYWHIDTYRADQRPYCGDYALWCGSDSLWVDGYPVECDSWVPGKAPGYGDLWNCIAQLTLPDTFTVANGCTLMFDPRYDTECKYDYFYVDFWNDSTWVTLATFNATSNNPGAECGTPTGGNPDYWGNTDTDNLLNCDWQERPNPSYPAFYYIITPDTLQLTEGPRFRWRLVTDGAWSDADGRGNTDGGAFIDNVWVWGDDYRYSEDFETGTLDPAYWILPNPDGVADAWHMVHDPDPPYEGGDGGDQTSCTLDSSFVYRARPEGGYPGAAAWRNGWYYRLMSPSIPITNTGCVVQYDMYQCILDYTCDYADERVRFYDSDYGTWCPWINMDGLIPPTCWGPNYDVTTDVSFFYGPSADSMQFGWELLDSSSPADYCRGKHKSTDYHVDNVSIGFFDAQATVFRARSIDLLQDTFFDTSLCAYNSHFDAYDEDTVNYYSGEQPLPRYNQLFLDVSDKDGLSEVRLYGSIDKGASWVFVSMTMHQPFDPGNPSLGGEYYGTLCPSDFGLSQWLRGTEVWHYVRATDALANIEYFPAEADPAHPYHTGGSGDYLTFSILPIYPPTYTGPTILLVDGYGRTTHNWAQCLEHSDVEEDLEEIYGRTLADAGYCYEVYDISGAWSNVQIQPIWFEDYDAVVWFMGPYLSYYLFRQPARQAIWDYLNDGGKVVLCSDRLAYSMYDEICVDSICGDTYLRHILGVEYLEEMLSPLDHPYIYTVAEGTVDVFGSPVALDLDTLLLYRGCPEMKDMSYVLTSTYTSYADTAQPIMYYANPPGVVAEADQVIYTEHNGQGQCVFVNFDLSACVNHEQAYCVGSGTKGLGFPPGGFNAGNFAGRVNLMQMILQNILGLPSMGSGRGGTAGAEEPAVRFDWALDQNVPNPCVTSTRISYRIALPAYVSLRVYNTLGQVVRVLEAGRKDPGVYSAHWDGRNAEGAVVASGIYFYTIEAGRYRATRKMLVLK